jgi:hypothetical protein
MATRSIETWPIDDVPEDLRSHAATVVQGADPDGPPYAWLTRIPTQALMEKWWGALPDPAKSGSMGNNYRAGVLFNIFAWGEGFLVYMTNNSEEYEAAAGG